VKKGELIFGKTIKCDNSSPNPNTLLKRYLLYMYGCLQKKKVSQVQFFKTKVVHSIAG
jgi:hypothetical protein